MQYPPQQQPSYPPSEIYQYEQPQAPEPRREIVISYNQKLLVLYRRICRVLLIVLLLVFLGFSFLVASAFIPPLALALGTPPIESGDVLPLVLTFAIILIATAFLAWWVRVIGAVSGSERTPVLHITGEGITIQNNIMVKYRVFRWNEIAAIDISRFNLKITSAPPLAAPSNNPGQLPGYAHKKIVVATLFYLDTPAQEIARQIRETYARELSYYRIQFQP